jgi:hypothetical protein
MHAPFDHLGKNILRDFFVLFGAAQAEAEVPATDAQRIDLWCVPDPGREQLRREAASGLLLQIASAPAMLELFIQAVGERAFHDSLRKRYQWRQVLEQRDDKAWPLPMVWLTSGGRPDGVLQDYGFVDESAGHYVTREAAWRVHILVVTELPRTRETILLRLLGPSRTRVGAIADLLALRDDAWEKRVALPWLVRLRFEVPPDPVEQSNEEREFIMETQEWFEQYKQKLEKLGHDKGVDEGRARMLARVFKRRLGRPLGEAEYKVLTERLERLGEDRLDEVLDFDPEALLAWLADPTAR